MCAALAKRELSLLRTEKYLERKLLPGTELDSRDKWESKHKELAEFREVGEEIHRADRQFHKFMETFCLRCYDSI